MLIREKGRAVKQTNKHPSILVSWGRRDCSLGTNTSPKHGDQSVIPQDPYGGDGGV